MRRWLFVVAFACVACRSRRNDVVPDPAPSSVASPTSASSKPLVDRSGIEAACESFATHHCATLARCAPSTLAIVYSDEVRCRRIERTVCTDVIAPRGSNATAASIATCDTAQTKDCAAILATSPFDCIVEGPSLDGTRCALNAECAGRYCRRNGAVCGVCGRLPLLGEKCESGILCDGALVCVGGVCAKRPTMGQPCDHVTDCVGDARCFKGKCAKPAKLGEACDILGHDAPDCEGLAAVSCRSGKCERDVYANVGEGCRNGVQCKGGSTCIDVTCVADGAEGAACSSEHPCQKPLLCIEATCTKLDSARCTSK